MIATALLARLCFACCCAGAVCGAVAGWHLQPGKQRFVTFFHRRPKTDFTRFGWALRQASVWSGYLAMAMGIAFWILDK